MKTLLCLLLLVSAFAFGEEIVVLTEKPVAEFALPDGSVLKNAFAWRRSSEGIMIVHDDGQYFLNFKLLPDDWKAAYLGIPVEQSAVSAEAEVELDDRHNVLPTLENIADLTPQARRHVVRKGADGNSEKSALALALLHSLLSGKVDDAKRFLLVIEEKDLEIKAVEMDAMFAECGACEAEGRTEKDCPTCGGKGKCLKCDGNGVRKTGIGKSTIHCTACRGKGDCPQCKGGQQLTSTCRACRGRGKLLQRQYCEVKRDQFVHYLNALANQGRKRPITETDSDRIKKVFKEIPELGKEAQAFYFSEAYEGSMDTNILVACVMHSLLKDRMAEAERFHMMVKVYYPDGKVMELKDYLKPCEKCDSTGRVERDCRSCDSSGKCKRCDGSGERPTEFKDSTIHCTTCRGTGKCKNCGGDGKLDTRCGACEGRGRFFDEQRTQIKFDILVDELNDHYAAQ